jgi:hypothetical protein
MHLLFTYFHQFKVAIKGGCEAMVHGIQKALEIHHD